MVINGDKIVLTPINYDDCQDFVNWRNSDFIKSKFIYRKDITVEEQKNWIKDKVETGQVAQFIIWDKKDNNKIGCVYLQNIDNIKHDCEFGILIGAPDYVGGGRGSEAAKLIIRYGFNELGLDNIYLRVLADNKRAIKAYEKAGFVMEPKSQKYIKIDGKDTEVVFMSIKKVEQNK